jgi:hypothetical protein
VKILPLFFAGFLPVCALALLGFRNPFRRNTLLRILRSRLLDWSLFLPATALFLTRIAHLGPADFGCHRALLFCLFGTLAAAVLWENFGFLAVRGAAILLLLWAATVLRTLQGNFSPPWLLAKALTHGTALLALTWAIWPHLLRDWLLRRARPSNP